MKTAIEEYVVREETYEREKREDMQRWQRYKTTGYTISGSDVNEWFASWGNESKLPRP